MQPLLDRLRRGETVVGDGAWGTQLMERGLAPGECPESFNLHRPEILAEIADRYLEAGAEILTTVDYLTQRVDVTRRVRGNLIDGPSPSKRSTAGLLFRISDRLFAERD